MSDPVKRIKRRSRRSIFSAYLKSARKNGGDTIALTDGDGTQFSFKSISQASLAIGGAIARQVGKNESVGIMLPTGAGALIAFFAALSRGRIPAMLNFTAGSKNILAACATANVTKIITAKKFIDLAGLEKLIGELEGNIELVYLEDLRETITARDKALAVLGPLLPMLFTARPNPDDTGVILFTSGTEGTPKGVALSHANIISNIEQVSAHVRLEPTEIFFNPLPTFHCYGLTAGALWPILNGYPVVFHPSPLQTKIIPQRIFETGATLMLATDTFLTQYMRAGSERSMSSLRIAVCGAERVRDETRQAAEKNFGFEVIEGYGVTEASPVLAVNQPGDIRSGTVGKLLPGVEFRLEPVEGLENAGRLFVRGPNIMKGYISANAPGEVVAPEDGWHDTGDVVAIDDGGYVAIRGRLKRFAKIGGEMVSLAVVENCATAVWPDNLHAAAILPDKRKGEKIVLVTDRKDAPRDVLLAWAQSHGVPELSVPKIIVYAEEVPVLGTGKIDYVSVEKLAKDGLAALSAPQPEPEAPTDEQEQTVKPEADAEVEAASTPEAESDLKKAAE